MDKNFMEDEEKCSSSIDSAVAEEVESEAQEEQTEAHEEAHAEGHGGEHHGEGFVDAILDEFSAEGNVKRLAKLTKLPQNAATYIVVAINLILGVLCIVITSYITEILPYIVGGLMVLVGFPKLIYALCKHEYRRANTNRTAMSLIATALGIMIIVQHILPDNESAVTVVAVAWGVLELFEGAHALNHAFERICRGERCVYLLLRGLVELAVAFMLLYDPGNHATHHFHIIVFGINLILDGITLIPQVKEFLSNK